MTHHQIMILLYSFKIVGRTAFPQFLIIQNPTTPCYFRLPLFLYPIAFELTIDKLFEYHFFIIKITLFIFPIIIY